ncbi:hypothetical protein GCM10009817_12460 [Terrabacter lapilli]|uniref:Uncharacterized protein n=1 Tax=Terrabacter lapilli TaxID=436231 RepID=A0ABN2RRV4_9MICO
MLELAVDLVPGLTREQVPAARVRDCRERHRHERPDDAGDAGDDRHARDVEDDGERVDADGLAEQERLEHVRLELLHADDDGQT